MFRANPLHSRFYLVMLLSAILVFPRPAHAAEPHWIRIDSSHFLVLTDADEKEGREVAIRFEQMRTVFAQLLMKTRVNIPEPIEIVALRDNDEFMKVAPVASGQPLAKAAFFLAGDDRDYFVLNLSQEQSWRAVSRDFAQVLLNYNYPPTQAWFDEGFAAYFSSLRLDEKQMQIGGEPPSQAFLELLNNSTWLSLPDLFALRVDSSASAPASQNTLFYAQSWIVMHYLLNNDKLPATGTYFGLVENDRLPVETAIQQAYGMTSAQLGQAVKGYFHSLAAKLQQQGGAGKSGVNQAPAPLTADTIGTSTHEIPEPDARALVAEMSLRLPEHRDQARQELESILDQPKVRSAIAHRALGWDYTMKKDYDQAVDEFAKAAEIDPKDPWTHYYMALWKYRDAQSSGRETIGLPNMMQDLHIVLDWNHELAEAYSMLAMAQLEGGGLRAATDSMRAAIQLSPRNPRYLLEMAKIYEAGKNWDAATALLEHLAGSADAQVVSAARTELQNLPYLKKYGIPPQSSTASLSTAAPASSQTAATAAPSASQRSAVQPKGASPQTEGGLEEKDDDSPEIFIQPQIDRRPILFVKGKLVSIDCSHAPVAVLTLAIGAKSLKLRTADYKALPLIGADAFSCDWSNRLVSVNYKASAAADGDLVSLEMH